jgi:hypothetical protein
LSSSPDTLISISSSLLVRLSTEYLFDLINFLFPEFHYDFFRILVSLLNSSFISCIVFLTSFNFYLYSLWFIQVSYVLSLNLLTILIITLELFVWNLNHFTIISIQYFWKADFWRINSASFFHAYCVYAL